LQQLQQAIEMSVEQVSPDDLKPDLAAIWLRAGLNSNGELESSDPDVNPVSH
jgi:hypothetical protein